MFLWSCHETKMRERERLNWERGKRQEGGHFVCCFFVSSQAQARARVHTYMLTALLYIWPFVRPVCTIARKVSLCVCLCAQVILWHAYARKGEMGGEEEWTKSPMLPMSFHSSIASPLSRASNPRRVGRGELQIPRPYGSLRAWSGRKRNLSSL